ncbi:Growth-regulating factor 5 [Corchorus olitorius]|uniref:Growth-regulating factor n=1 Tax=Corchorus olitorius TaxID=93759 RepID=A0A1R3IED6_9ROSI|nr:Growth-regulating factor 5 [Corchorus olitorius]
METQPLKIARFADFGIGVTNLADSWTMESTNRLSGEEIGLGLELGRGSSHSQRQTGFTKSCGFTVFQLQELQLQSLIYKYMEAGLPVPHNLILPIWKSVAGSLGGLHYSPYQLYSGGSYLGCGPLHLEYKNGLDPEPGRCRRTDGKKWRCSRDAVPDHKYCERHIHRGRQRSRKLVEASSATANNNNSTSSRINRTGNADTNLSISLQLDSSSSSGSNLSSSSSFLGFSPKSVLVGNAKAESSLLQFQEL